MGHSYIGDDVQSYDPFWDRAYWEYKFVLWPKHCEISNRRLWLEYAYKGTRMITGPGEPVFEYRWLTKEEYLLAAIKGKLKNDRW
jgi:hypothetical protein